MRIVIDMQSVQSENCSHNKDSYAHTLIQTIIHNGGKHDIVLALNGLFADTIAPIRATFRAMLPEENIRTWYAPEPLQACVSDNLWHRQTAEIVREAFFASLRPDVVFILNPFSDPNNVNSIGAFTQLTTVVAINDLGAFNTDYVDLNQQLHWLRQIEYLKRTDSLLALPPLTAHAIYQRLDAPQGQLKIRALSSAPNSDTLNSQANELIKLFATIKAEPAHGLQRPLNRRPKLAYISPLPPERSGISDYSAELLPELARFYDIDVIIAQPEISTPWIRANCGIKTTDDFIRNSRHYDRTLYHFGNSPYHQHMFELLAQVPGTVVLHDFFLGDIQWHREAQGIPAHAWTQALYDSHGYGALRERIKSHNDTAIVHRYPANFKILQQAEGIIVHSKHSRALACDWYSAEFAADWAVIPHLRIPATKLNRAQSRQRLGLNTDDFIVCSFGFLGPTKLNHRLLNAWLQSTMAASAQCVLIFVGENHGGDYGEQLLQTLRTSEFGARVRITGWANTDIYRDYLAAADLAVQLRTLSRGETSGTVLDCMNHALPTIVNANGSMAELPDNAVWMLTDDFDDQQLITALETLWQNGEKRASLNKHAQELILNRHAPNICAEQYAQAIECFHARAQVGIHALPTAIAALDNYYPSAAECEQLAQAIAQSLPSKQPTHQLLLDISATCRTDLKTGIERVVRALIIALLETPPSGYRVEPVYLCQENGHWHYKYARNYTLDLIDYAPEALTDEAVEPQNGDILLGMDLSGSLFIEAEAAGLFTAYRNLGLRVFVIVYDLLPVQFPQFFPKDADAHHSRWLQAITQLDGGLCISKAVANDLSAWHKTHNNSPAYHTFKADWFHLGADVENSAPSRGLPQNAEQTLAHLCAQPSFLMVGTIEPRKGYLQTLDAFTRLWKQGHKINLVIVGKEGWQGVPRDMRRTIPKIVTCLRNHPELGKQLFWLEGISDEYLEKVYAAATCLIAASEGEGFGLPLIEAAQHKLPIIARDIPVFREVAGKNAYYFSGLGAKNMAQTIEKWLELNKKKQAPQSQNMPWLTWQQSAGQLLNNILPSV